MVYRFLIKAISTISSGYVNGFAYYYTYLYCILRRLLQTKPPKPISPVVVMGLSCPNRLGLAAGFIRAGRLLRHFDVTGLGLVEIGTINVDSGIDPDPYVMDIIRGMEISSNKGRRQQWGINLGSLDNSLTQKATADYARGMRIFWRYADYLVINLSRPGSPVRIARPDMEALTNFLWSIIEQRDLLSINNTKHVPITVKIAIDYLDNEHIISTLLLVRACGFDGAIIAFENWPDIDDISRYLGPLKEKLDPFPLIVVGGIHSAEDARQILDAGASLVQIYTCFVTYGPAYTKNMVLTL